MKRLFLTLTTVLALLSNVWAQDKYKMAGPFEVVARDGQYARTKDGSERDMKTAWDLAKTGKHDEALSIINAYAEKLQRLDGHDAPLCLIQGYWLCRAMMIEKKHKSPAWESMLRRAMVPTMNQFEADSPYANGNWGAIVNRFRMAAAIFMDDGAMYEAACDYFMRANDNGALPRYIGESGQCQETGRDQAHVQLGLEALADICEMAWEKGDDLWGVLDNRLLKGFEYTAKYNLGYDVPFTTWIDCTGLYNYWTEPGAMSRGKLWDIYQKPYEHYHERKGLAMPYTEKVLALQAKSEAKGESREMRVKGVKEGTRLHQVFTYNAPEGAPLKHDYDVFVQPLGSKEWKRVDTYMAKVNAATRLLISNNDTRPNAAHAVKEISYAFFDFTGNVYVRVVCKNKKYKTARIRPDYKGVIANVINDSTLQFLLFQPENVSVEFDGDITDNLLLFTSNPPVSVEEAEREARRQGRKFVIYEPGFYSGNDTIHIPSSTTVYFSPGTYFEKTFAIENVHDVSILGRGVARPVSGYEGAYIHHSQNIFLDGLVLNTCPIGESHHVTLHDVRSISHPQWGDGLNVFGGCSDILYDRVFCRNSDDCTTVYATRKGFKGSVYNVIMRNSTLWADVAHPIMIGLHGNGSLSEKSDSLVNLHYENIDILCQSEIQVDYQGCIGINCGDNNVVKDVVFDNIRIEEIASGSLCHIKTCYNEKYCSAIGRSIEDVTFRNIRFGTSKRPVSRPYLSLITGYDSEHTVKNITFEGLKINGVAIYDDMPSKPRWYKTSDFANMYVNNHVLNLRFLK